MTDLLSPRQNHLIGALPGNEFLRLSPNLELVAMGLGDVLYESGDALGHFYFPISCIVSKLYVTEDGASTEIAVVGKEGMVGVALFMGGGSMPNRAVVRSAGYAYRLRPHFLMQDFERTDGRHYTTMHHLLLRYAQALMTQMAQLAVCNRRHCVDQQLCRWLLLSLDRLPSNELVPTHELIGNMLGVRREGVTEAAKKLQKANVIEYQRGHIKVLDRVALEARACECYQVVKTELDRLLPAGADLAEDSFAPHYPNRHVERFARMGRRL